MYRSKMILRHLSSNRASQIVTGYLVEAPVDPTEDACVVYVIGNLLELRVVLGDRRRRQSPERGDIVGDGNVVSRRTEQAPHYLEPAVGAAGVI